MNNLIEGKFGHGAKPTSFIRRKLRKVTRPVAKGLGFDWTKGYDVRDIIGPITIKNQGSNYSCGGQSGAYFLEIQRKLQGIKEGECSAKSIYSPIAYSGGGTTISSLETQIGTRGSNLESEVTSYTVYGDPLPEFFMTLKDWMSDTLTQNSLKRAGYVPYDVKVDIDTVASIIEAYGACIWEIRGQNGHTPNWLSPTPQPPVPNNGNEIFAHFMCAIGARMINGKKTIIALQSMGEGSGDKGVQYFTENYFDSGYITDCFTFIYDKNITANPTTFNPWAGALRWFRNLWGLSN